MLCLFLLPLASLSGEAAGVDDPELQSLLRQLTEVRLSRTGAVVERLAETGGSAMLPLFGALLEGELYFRKSDAQLFALRETPAGDAWLASDLFSGAAIGTVDKSDFSKVRVNNRLRSQLRELMARIQLDAEAPRQRLAAVRTMAGDLDAGAAELLRGRLEKEPDAGVRDAIGQALALFRLRNSDDAEVRIAALGLLRESLSPEVHYEIGRMLVRDGEGRYAEPDSRVRRAAESALKNIEGRLKLYGFAEQLFFGLSLGSVLLLAAIGLSITFGVMGVINMAHGEMIMLGAYTTYVVQTLMPGLIDYSLWVAIPAAFLVSGLVGVAIERGVIRFLHGRPLETLLATFGISLILQQAVRTIFSPLNRQVATPAWMSGSLELNPVLSITYNRLYILLFALLVFALLQLILKKTSLGLHVRAVSQNRAMARAIGIRTEWIDAMTFGLGSGIAGVAGVALSQLTNVGPNLGQAYIIDSFMVVVFGGVGNLLGTLVGGFSLGIANKFLEPATGAVLANILILVFIILFIQKRPRGLFPQKGRAASD
jgi:urea transport system permease protein